MRPPFSPVRLAPVVGLADAALRRLVRWSVKDPDGLLEEARSGRPFVFACLHGQLWPLLWAVRECDVTVLASRSSDGELLARVLRRQGFSIVRGSSSRDGSPAAREALRLLRAGGRIGLAVDGPRGPRGVVQEGVLRLARRAGVRIVPLRTGSERPWIAPGSWDRFEIPRPFQRVQIHVGPALEVGEHPSSYFRSGSALAAVLGASPPPGAGEAGPRVVEQAAGERAS
jgi:lysophospholipid acyltransferase (LPLAT)-like uncharacterized protein